MKYYVTADIHGFYTAFHRALEEAGYYMDDGEKKLVICGDLFDRGREARKTQEFVADLLDKGEAILIRGNHDDMFCQLVGIDKGAALGHHVHNGTYQTALDLTGYDLSMAGIRRYDFAEAGQKTLFYTLILPAMLDYYETEHYVFVHGWIPCRRIGTHTFQKIEDWRNASKDEWEAARWYNGMDAAASGVTVEGKTIVCGHWHASYGHSRYEKKGTEFGLDADFSPYYGQGIIALDACTAHTNEANVIILED